MIVLLSSHKNVVYTKHFEPTHSLLSERERERKREREGERERREYFFRDDDDDDDDDSESSWSRRQAKRKRSSSRGAVGLLLHKRKAMMKMGKTT